MVKHCHRLFADMSVIATLTCRAEILVTYKHSKQSNWIWLHDVGRQGVGVAWATAEDRAITLNADAQDSFPIISFVIRAFHLKINIWWKRSVVDLTFIIIWSGMQTRLRC